jgi:hypothetical protein
MTRILVRAALFLIAVSVSIGAFAATKSQNFTLYQDSQLNGAKLPAGEYKVVYDTDGTNPQVKFLKGKKEIASATGQAKPLEKKPGRNQIVLTNGSGAPVISELDFAGSPTGITFDSSMATAGK